MTTAGRWLIPLSALAALVAPAGVAAADINRTYLYNGADQLVEVKEGTTTVATHTYDGDGERVKRTVGGQEVVYVRDPDGNVLAEYDGSGDLIAEYVYLNGQKVARIAAGGATTYYHNDHLGTPRAITDASGQVTWAGDNLPFGDDYASTGSRDDSYTFTGHESDAPIELIYAHARYYDPEVGRFITTDPVGGNPTNPQSWNRYSYALNNPVKFTDPTGEYVGVDDLVFSAGGAAVGLAGQGIGDLIAGQASGWEDYVGAAVGGAAAGEALLYTGPVVAGIVGGAATNLAKQGLKNLTERQEGLDPVSLGLDTVIGGATGLIPGVRIRGVTSGRGSYNQVYRQMVARAQGRSISTVSAHTATKMFIGRATDTGLLPGTGAAAVAAGSGLLPTSEDRRPPTVDVTGGTRSRALPPRESNPLTMAPSH